RYIAALLIGNTMKCEICGLNEATMHFTQVSEGVTREMHVCADCAKKHGLEFNSPLAMTDFLFGIESDEDSNSDLSDDRVCPACNMRSADFKRLSRLGCPVCYETFGEELSDILETMHKGSRHIGKVPSTVATTSMLSSLQDLLNKAVAAQNFEDAAELRDKIRELKTEKSNLRML
ncbi:MAG: UvrB/UvrC motif-containing protein, partial [Lentisphaerae bacterium]|nr:UvrB/UvrC motif-containing protein [Lentisphaerota bacterium]